MLHYLHSLGENLVALNVLCPANKLPTQRQEDQSWLKWVGSTGRWEATHLQTSNSSQRQRRDRWQKGLRSRALGGAMKDRKRTDVLLCALTGRDDLLLQQKTWWPKRTWSLARVPEFRFPCTKCPDGLQSKLWCSGSKMLERMQGFSQPISINHLKPWAVGVVVGAA